MSISSSGSDVGLRLASCRGGACHNPISIAADSSVRRLRAWRCCPVQPSGQAVNATRKAQIMSDIRNVDIASGFG